MNICFTDIDGVLNPKFSKKWSKKSISIYNRMCKDFNLICVVTSTWRTNHTIEQLQKIFDEQGVTVKIYDYTPHLIEDRGLEIEQWLRENKWTKYCVLDDDCYQIKKYVTNVVDCRSWEGIQEDQYDEVKKIFNI